METAYPDFTVLIVARECVEYIVFDNVLWEIVQRS